MHAPRRGLALRAAPFVAVLAALVLGFEAEAAIRWTSTGEITTTVQSAEVRFEVGEGGENHRHFRDFELSANATSFSTTLKAKSGADLRVRDVVRLVNDAAEPRRLTLRAAPVDNLHYEVLEWTVRGTGGTVATLDHLSREPVAELVLEAGERHELDLRVDLADGASTHNAGVAIGLWMEVAA